MDFKHTSDLTCNLYQDAEVPLNMISLLEEAWEWYNFIRIQPPNFKQNVCGRLKPHVQGAFLL